MPFYNHRKLQTLAAILVATSAYVVVMLAITARWRIGLGDHESLLFLAGAPLISIALIGAQWRRGFLLFLILLIPLGFISDRRIEDTHRRRATSSCANRSTFTGRYWSLKELPVRLTNSVEFADYLEQLYAGQTLRPALYCPGAKWSKSKTGVAFVGGGLDVMKTAPSEQILIAFCHYESHAMPYDHSHALALRANRANDSGPLSESTPIERFCSGTREMTNYLANALKFAREGTAPYSKAAVAIMESELQKRIAALARNPSLKTNGWRSSPGDTAL